MKNYLLFFSLLFVGNIATAQNNALIFDGVNEYITTTYDGVLGNGDRTIEAWIKVPTTIATTQYVITDYGNFNLPNGQRFTLNILNYKLRIEVRGWGLNGETDLNDDMWHHVAVTYKGDGIDEFILYVDGVMENISSSPTVTINTSTLNNFQIGERLDNQKYFIGEMDEVRFWDKVRSQTEIVATKDGELMGNEPNLVAYYNFNGAALGTDSVPDASPGNNPGTMINMETTDIIPSTVPFPIMPVELHNFSGELTPSNSVKLNWTTLSEIDNAYFEIERSTNPSEAWEKIGIEEGQGTTNKVQTYSFLDATAQKGINYYRLKQVDYSGENSYSDIIKVNVNDETTKHLTIYPNPSTDKIHVKSDSNLQNISLLSISGKLIKTYSDIQTTELTIDVSALPKGYYLIKSGQQTWKVEKQ